MLRSRVVINYEDWGWVPFTGSYSQMMNGRSTWQRAFGTMFLAMDLTMAGAVVRGVGGLLRPAAMNAWRKVAGTTTARQAEQAGFRLMSSQVAEQAIKNEIMKSGGSRFTGVAVSEGYLNHSAFYVFDKLNSRSYKLHGSVFNLIIGNQTAKQGMQATTTSFAQRVVQGGSRAMTSGANRLSVYPLTNSSGQAGIHMWKELIDAGWLGQILELGIPGGCANTQAIMLEKFGVQGANLLTSAPLRNKLPVVLDISRSMLTNGTHIVVSGRGLREAVGTTIQAGVAISASSTSKLVGMLMQDQSPRMYETKHNSYHARGLIVEPVSSIPTSIGRLRSQKAPGAVHLPLGN